MGAQVLGAAAAGSDHAFALLQIIANPAEYQQKLEALLKAHADAVASEAAAADMHAKATEASAAATRSLSELGKAQDDAKQSANQRSASLDAREAGLRDDEARATAANQKAAEENKQRAAALASAESVHATTVAAHAADHATRSAALDEREKMTAKLLLDAQAANDAAELLRQQHDAKLQKVNETLQTLKSLTPAG